MTDPDDPADAYYWSRQHSPLGDGPPPTPPTDKPRKRRTKNTPLPDSPIEAINRPAAHNEPDDPQEVDRG